MNNMKNLINNVQLYIYLNINYAQVHNLNEYY